jgi:hypothetical protein
VLWVAACEMLLRSPALTSEVEASVSENVTHCDSKWLICLWANGRSGRLDAPRWVEWNHDSGSGCDVASGVCHCVNSRSVGHLALGRSYGRCPGEWRGIFVSHRMRFP